MSWKRDEAKASIVVGGCRVTWAHTCCGKSTREGKAETARELRELSEIEEQAWEGNRGPRKRV